MAAALELEATRKLLAARDAEIQAMEIRLATERQTVKLVSELNVTRESETATLRAALAAKNESLVAKDAVIGAQNKLIESLRKKKRSPLARLADVLIGVGAGLILR